MDRRDILGVLAAAAVLGAMLLYRDAYVEPRAWGVLCDGAAPPLACLPRGWLLWLQHWQLWGLGALALGLWGFFGSPLVVRVAAVALGAVAVVNYNASWGLLGAVLGAWGWLGARRPAAG